ncbi:MAG: hypothetical protein OJF55_002534 [Rhodanobacteraceae bacterium]|jgi:uncharacterized protein YjbJ (UPF0337 family)|nr:MAG: hypothetical protein OJF55_002534 [Rhodanobacteraceae bacterium]
MREDLISSHWSQLRGAFRKRWPRLTERDLASDQGDIGYLVRLLQERYGIDRFEAWRQVHEFQPDLWFFDAGDHAAAAAS